MSLISKITSKIIEYRFNHLGFPTSKGERISKKFIQQFLPKFPTTIDCGAHTGDDSIEISKILGGKVYSFEPLPIIYQKLKNNTQNHSNIQCFPLALSDQNGKSKFYVSEGGSDASSSLLEPDGHKQFHPDVSFNQIIEINCMTLDNWAEDNKIGNIDFLWLDMQGYELKMLQESQKVLKNVIVIHSEVSVKNTYKGAPMYEEYSEWLQSKGFKIILEAIPYGWDMGNVLFVRS